MKRLVPVSVALPRDTGWIPCPRCALPVSAGKPVVADAVTKRWCCADCGIRGLLAVVCGGNALVTRTDGGWDLLAQLYSVALDGPPPPLVTLDDLRAAAVPAREA